MTNPEQNGFAYASQAELNELFCVVAESAILHGEDMTREAEAGELIHDTNLYPGGAFYELDLDAALVKRHQPKLAAAWQIGGQGNRVRFVYQSEGNPHDTSPDILTKLNSFVQIGIEKENAEPILEDIIIVHNHVALGGISRVLEVDRMQDDLLPREITPLDQSASDEYQDQFIRLYANEAAELEAIVRGHTVTSIPRER